MVKSLIEHGKLESADAALLAFTVDCVMKVYVTADLDTPCLEDMSQDNLVWTVIYEAYWAFIRTRSSHNRAMFALEQFLVSVVEDLPKLREQCEVSFCQHIHDPEIKVAFAFELVAQVRFHGVQRIITRPPVDHDTTVGFRVERGILGESRFFRSSKAEGNNGMRVLQSTPP
jgi:hypothetical protein